MIRSSGGWRVLKTMRRMGIHFKSDERVLGDSDFVESVLNAAEEAMDRKYRLEAEGYNFDVVLSRVCDVFNLTIREQRKRVDARSVFACKNLFDFVTSSVWNARKQMVEWLLPLYENKNEYLIFYSLLILPAFTW